MAAIEPPKKKRKTDHTNSTADESTEDTILDVEYVRRFAKERNDTINECISKIFAEDIIKLIQQYNGPDIDMGVHLAQLETFYLFEDFDLIGPDFDRFSREVHSYTKHRTQQMEMPEFLNEYVNKIGTLVHIKDHPIVVAYVIDSNGKLRNIDSNGTIPKSISEHFNNPILFYSMFNTCSFEIDFSNLAKFISTYLFKFNINKDLITQLIEIDVPQNMECTLVFPRTTYKKWQSTYLEFNYHDVNICRKFNLTKNTQKEIILFHKLLDVDKLCFTKCKWNIWDEETRYKTLQLLLKELSEFGFWIEQSEERYDKSFIVKGNGDYIKDVKRIINQWRETKKFEVFAQLKVIKYFDEQENYIEENQMEMSEKRSVIFEWPYERTANGRRIVNVGEHVWHLRVEKHCTDRCIALLEGPLDAIAQARGIIHKLNDTKFLLCHTKEIGSIFDFDQTTLS